MSEKSSVGAKGLNWQAPAVVHINMMWDLDTMAGQIDFVTRAYLQLISRARNARFAWASGLPVDKPGTPFITSVKNNISFMRQFRCLVKIRLPAGIA